MKTMKAAICTKYGGPQVLQFTEIQKPSPKNNEVLVKIKSTAVNSGDVRVRGLKVSGFMKVIMLFVLGFSKPRKPVLGTVFSGVIEQVGDGVKDFKIGDEVFGSTGFSFGTYAEYLCISENGPIKQKPKNISHDEAAASIFGGQTAISFLQKANIESLDKPNILIYGGSGAVGTAAIQIAKYYNSTVTVVCGSRSKDLIEKLDADKIVFYDKEDFTKLDDKFDIIFDAVGKISKKQSNHLLKTGGIFKTVGGFEVASETKEQLLLLAKFFEAGKYDAVIDKVYTFDEIVEAHKYVDTGKKQGNVVLKIN